MFNLVLVVVLLGVSRDQSTPPNFSRTRVPTAVTSSILGSFTTLEECRRHAGIPAADQSQFQADDQPALRATTYCAAQ